MFIAIDISFKQTALYVQASKEETICAKLGGVNEFKVSSFARLQYALSFQILASVLRLLWAFFLALDVSTRLDTSYFEARVRFAWQAPAEDQAGGGVEGYG
uniref:Uncharacterized protein n=1 Tax=Hyaloperonospora arabidopsidis (strain Emoy2) TaxID=559515 RepID=M4B392_HYAAE